MLFGEWRSERSEGVKTNAFWGVRRLIFHFSLLTFPLNLAPCPLTLPPFGRAGVGILLAPCPLHPPFGRAGVGIPLGGPGWVSLWEGRGGY
jgi:hypothetical protein